MAIDMHTTAEEIDLSSLLPGTPSTFHESVIAIPLGRSTSTLPADIALTQEQHPLTGREFMEQQYREGKLLNLPKPQPLSSEEQTERERLAQLFAGGKPMSEIVIEGRGPY